MGMMMMIHGIKERWWWWWWCICGSCWCGGSCRTLGRMHSRTPRCGHVSIVIIRRIIICIIGRRWIIVWVSWREWRDGSRRRIPAVRGSFRW